MYECDFVFNPQQHPLAAIVTFGDVASVVGAIDLYDRYARDAMALKISTSVIDDILRVRRISI